MASPQHLSFFTKPYASDGNKNQSDRQKSRKYLSGIGIGWSRTLPKFSAERVISLASVSSSSVDPGIWFETIPLKAANSKMLAAI
jgi:hypothetical protein